MENKLPVLNNVRRTDEEIIREMARASAKVAGDDYDELLEIQAAMYEKAKQPGGYTVPSFVMDKNNLCAQYYRDAKKHLAGIRAYMKAEGK